MKRTYKKQTISKKWIEDNIVKPGWQRDIYKSRVNRFVTHIRNGTFLQSLITVSEKEDKSLVLLDGQHKLEAIKNTNSEFNIDICIYENLSEEQEIEIYKMLNDVKTQRIIDDIKLYMGKHDWLDALFDKNNFPITITLSGGINSIRIDKFLNIIKNSIMINFMRSNLSRKSLPGFLEDLDSERYRLMKDFCIFYKKCFEEPFKDNWLYDKNIMILLMKIWIRNREEFSEEEMIKCFKPIRNNGSIKMDTKGVDTTTMKSLAFKIYGTLNKGRSVNKFKEFWED